ncbi:hypothetical protein OH492_16930 [Vibrio chagasii]|nr:hypothetical protein [Vibrio chagasii]
MDYLEKPFPNYKMGNYYHASLGTLHQQKPNGDIKKFQDACYQKTARRSMFPQYIASVSLLRTKPQLCTNFGANLQNNENYLIRQNEHQSILSIPRINTVFLYRRVIQTLTIAAIFNIGCERKGSDKRQTIVGTNNNDQ